MDYIGGNVWVNVSVASSVLQHLALLIIEHIDSPGCSMCQSNLAPQILVITLLGVAGVLAVPGPDTPYHDGGGQGSGGGPMGAAGWSTRRSVRAPMKLSAVTATKISASLCLRPCVLLTRRNSVLMWPRLTARRGRRRCAAWWRCPSVRPRWRSSRSSSAAWRRSAVPWRPLSVPQ